jgi:hypothetical protein
MQLKILEEKLSSMQLELEIRAKELELKGTELAQKEELLKERSLLQENLYSTAGDITMLVSPLSERTRLQETSKSNTPNASK